jgi:hypothetical protein
LKLARFIAQILIKRFNSLIRKDINCIFVHH